MRSWLEGQCWSELIMADSASNKAKALQDILVKSYRKFFSEKKQRKNSDDQLWINFKLKAMDRRRKGNTQNTGKVKSGTFLTKTLKKV